MNYKTVPNQRIVEVKKLDCNKYNKYTTNNLNALDRAAFDLNKIGALKLYIYLAKNQSNYKFALSSKAFTEWANVSISSYNSGFEELVRKGYLVQKENNKSTYIFYDKPQENKYNTVNIEFYSANKEIKF